MLQLPYLYANKKSASSNSIDDTAHGAIQYCEQEGLRQNHQHRSLVQNTRPRIASLKEQRYIKIASKMSTANPQHVYLTSLLN